MGLFDKLFGKSNPEKNPEEKFIVTITDEMIKVEHPSRNPGFVLLNDIQEVKLINTDAGPFEPDVFLALVGSDSECLIPQGANGYDEVFDIVSKYENFDFENVIKSMSCTDNAVFILWTRK